MAAIRDTGALFAWGLNSSGQLGIGSTLTRSSPSGVGASSWSQVVAGQSRTLAIRSGGSLFSWGNNDYGALGLNVGTATINSPVQIGTSSWISVGGGRGTFSSLDDFDVSIAIRSDGGLFAWGFDRNGDTATNVAGNEVSSPVQIGTSSWTAVASNGSVVLRSDGKLWGWGNNEFGQLAITPTGNTITSPIQIYADINTSYSSPVQLGTSSWVAVAAGKNNTFATRTGGSLFAWGNNTNGMLGQNNLVALSSPVQIGTSSWTSVSAGDEAAAAIRSDSALFTWGDSNLGQGGYLKGSALAVASYAASSPVQVGNNLLRYIVSPMQVGTSSWTQVAPNTYLTFAIKSDGTLWSWGSNDPAKLTQQTIATSSPTQIGTSSWTQISTTMSNNVAGILTNNTAYIWGENTFGQLGQSDRINRSSPVQVGPTGGVSKVCMAESAFYYLTNTGGLFSVGSNVDGKLGLNDSVANISSPVQVGTSSWTNIPGANSGGGADYMVAIRSDGTLFGWGNNGSGNLGINNRAHRSSPTQVGGQGIIIASLSSPIQIGTSSWTAISAGIYSSYAIRSDSGLFTWGDNTDGVLGDNTVIDKSSPVQVGTSSWTQIATTTIASAAAVAAIRSDGGLFTWGDNLVGQLGGNSITPKSSPVQVGTSSWTQVVVGANNMAGILADKSLYAWGSNASGQLGQSDRIHRSSPVQVGIEKNWLKIDIGQAEFLGIKTNNTLWGWGLNTSGQLGLNVANYRSSPTQVGTQKDWIQASLGSASAMAIKNSITKPSASYITTVGSGTAGAAQTFAATALGVATSNRIIVVATALLNAGAGDDVASVTIAGITATNAGNSVTGAVGASIWYAPVPTGETGTIVINLSDATTSVTAHVYALYNANSVAPYSTANNSVNASNITSSAYNTIINAVTIVVANTTAADTITFSSTGSGAITEGYDGFIVSSATRSTATAYIISTSNSSNITVTAQGGVTNNRTMVAATWL